MSQSSRPLETASGKSRLKLQFESKRKKRGIGLPFARQGVQRPLHRDGVRSAVSVLFESDSRRSGRARSTPSVEFSVRLFRGAFTHERKVRTSTCALRCFFAVKFSFALGFVAQVVLLIRVRAVPQ